MSVDQQRELNNVNFSKCALMLLVVLGHCLDLWTDRGWFIDPPVFKAPILGLFADWLTSFHIYAFVLISGYVFSYLRNEKGQDNNFFPFVIKKSKRLLVPFVFTMLIWVLPFALYFFRYDCSVIIQKYILGTSPNQLWFLLMLFWVYVFGWLLNALFKKSIVKSLIVVCCFYVIGVIGNHITIDLFNIWSACKYVIYFWIGYQFRYRNNWTKKISIPIWIIVDLIFFVLSRFTLGGIWGQLVVVLLHVIGAITAFNCLDFLANRIKWNNKKSFKVLQKYSMPMYLFHQQIVYCCIAITNGKINSYLNAFIIYIITVSGSLLISKIMMSTAITRRLIGEK